MSTGLEIFLSPLEHLLGFMQRERHHKEDMAVKAEEKRQEALSAMHLALVTTQRYQDEQPAGVDREKQLELSGLWADAAIKSRSFIEDATPWNMDKAEYWFRKFKYSDEELRERRLDLAAVQERIDELIRQQK
jgi:hypothetical protein